MAHVVRDFYVCVPYFLCVPEGVTECLLRYFQDTDTLYIELRPAPVSETRDLDENTVIDLDDRGTICAITIEHASE
ncbi:MAG: DUF2283 domain-containing protein [Thiocapsa sp.]|nr:MAG: DUF2283 domain-containing protein [Thiocapsa sp.]